MLKFKVGDKIKYVKSWGLTRGGEVYTVADIWHGRYQTKSQYLRVVENLESYPHHSYGADKFELVTEEPEYLTPEQVLKALQDDPTKVEVQYGISGEFVSVDTVHPITYTDITQGKWRFKQVPKTIDYYGTELPKPIDISDLDDSTEVYLVNLNLGKIYTVTVDRAKMTHLSKTALHFSTYEDAILVLDTILKPFKQ